MKPELITQNQDPAPAGRKILIVGGYGKVGLLIASQLASRYPGRVVISGRDPGKARAAARQVSHGAQGRHIDIHAASHAQTLNGVVLAIVCLDQTGTEFARQCFERAVHYIDISADYGFLSKVENLDALARKTGATAILSVGVAPGLTNMLAARVAKHMARVDRIDLLVELGLGDVHGRAAVAWMLDNLDSEYEVKESGRARRVRSFGDSIKFRLPGQAGARRAYRFNFSDQHVIGQDHKLSGVSTWIRFDNQISTWALATLSRAGLGRLLRRPRWRKAALWLFTKIHIGTDACAVAARATGRSKDGGPSLTLSLTGRGEALMTAIVAAETARQVLNENPRPGVHHTGNAIALDPVIEALRRELPDLEVKQ